MLARISFHFHKNTVSKAFPSVFFCKSRKITLSMQIFSPQTLCLGMKDNTIELKTPFYSRQNPNVSSGRCQRLTYGFRFARRHIVAEGGGGGGGGGGETRLLMNISANRWPSLSELRACHIWRAFCCGTNAKCEKSSAPGGRRL